MEEYIEEKFIEEEKGKAGLIIELEDSKVKVIHQQDKVILFQSEVKKGYWDNLWEAIKKVN